MSQTKIYYIIVLPSSLLLVVLMGTSNMDFLLAAGIGLTAQVGFLVSGFILGRRK